MGIHPFTLHKVPRIEGMRAPAAITHTGLVLFLDTSLHVAFLIRAVLLLRIPDLDLWLLHLRLQRRNARGESTMRMRRGMNKMRWRSF
jgi:hypothetical protein